MRLSMMTRVKKLEIAGQLAENLAARARRGPKEPGLDAYIPELRAVAKALGTHTEGKVAADARRVSRMKRVDAAGDEVDRRYRHIESYIHVEGLRRSGEHVAAALSIHAGAFPEGLGFVGVAVDVENRACREAIAVLSTPEHKATLDLIGMPKKWLPAWIAAVDESDAAFAALNASREQRREHVSAGQDAEAEFVEVVARLRRYVGSRARSSETERLKEGRALLKPFTDTVAKHRADAAARAKRREKKALASRAPVAGAPGAAIEKGGAAVANGGGDVEGGGPVAQGGVEG